jgi:hypothetical protein
MAIQPTVADELVEGELEALSNKRFEKTVASLTLAGSEPWDWTSTARQDVHAV